MFQLHDSIELEKYSRVMAKVQISLIAAKGVFFVSAALAVIIFAVRS